MKKFHKYIFFLILFFQYFVSNSQITVYQIDITKEIGSTTWRYLRAGLHQAQEQNAKAVILRLNTYGGTVVHADSMRTAILNAPIPVYAFVDNNAASAGALIAIACDSIYMRSSASMGAATVVNETGAAMPDKYQSYMRATMRATAESHGKDESGNWRRNPLIAEAMVDERVIVPNLCDSGKVLTLTANEAIAQKYCEGIVDNVDEIISQKLRYETYTLQEFKPSLFDDIAGFLTHPAFQALMVTLIFGGIFMELKTPGIGLPSAIACTAAVLYFTPLYIDGLAANWEILLFVIGIILLIFEFLVIPGFGIAGISGSILILGALILALVGNVNFDFNFVSAADISKGIITVISGVIISVALLFWFFQKIGSKGPKKRYKKFNMKFIGIIPARYASTRFPGKPLADMKGKYMIQRVYEQARKVLDNVCVATDDDRIFNAVESFGGNVVMTSAEHRSGTDRCFEAYNRLGGNEDVIINIQGDEPFIKPEQIESLIACFDSPQTQIATLVRPFEATEGYEALANPNSPKVILNDKNEALYFSRSIIPYMRNISPEQWPDKHVYYKHIGMYGYRADILSQITRLPQSSLEIAESLEQLRWLQNGYTIKVGITTQETIGIDTPDDLQKALTLL